VVALALFVSADQHGTRPLLGLVLSPLVYALWAWSVLAQLKQPDDDR
jgi:hypothetical protein